MNCRWCKEHGAVLITHDRGKEILAAISRHHVHAIVVYKDLRNAPAHEFARAILCSEAKMDHLANGRGLIHHRLTPRGGLDPR